MSRKMNKIPRGPASDPKFISTLLTMIFDEKLLLESSVTGKKTNNPQQNFSGTHQLDKTLLSFIKSINIYV